MEFSRPSQPLEDMENCNKITFANTVGWGNKLVMVFAGLLPLPGFKNHGGQNPNALSSFTNFTLNPDKLSST